MDKLEGQVRIPSGCAISAVISRDGHRMTGEKIIESMRPMHDRSNGLGGGFAAAIPPIPPAGGAARTPLPC